MKYTIYRAVNRINGKSYIGFTKDFVRRMREHLSGDGKCRLFKDALAKYGADNFLWETLYLSNDREFAQEIMEPYFIRLYKSYCKDNGYNLSLGGEGANGPGHFGSANGFFGRRHSEETKEKIRQKKIGRVQPLREKQKQIAAQTGHAVSLETRRKLSVANKGQIPWLKGKTGVWSEEQKRRNSETEKKTKARLKSERLSLAVE